jgi:predicted AAA+ superfamily ATPase
VKEIERTIYVQRLIDRRENGLVKIITGLRRAGKSYLLFKLYYDYLIASGVADDHIIRIALDDEKNKDLLDTKLLRSYIEEKMIDSSMYYLFLDEIQLVGGVEGLLNGLGRMHNLDIYVTGSNSRFLSTDILTEFRGRGDEVQVHPLSFSEYLSAFEGNEDEAWREYYTYGGLPLILSRGTDELKESYLKTLFQKVYISDIVDRNNLRGSEVMGSLLNILASGIGSLTNPHKLAKSFLSNGISGITANTISAYIDHLTDAFLITRAERYDVKGKRYIASPYKYYFEDVGLRNARLNFRQQEEGHIMENIIYNELRMRGFAVDVGVVDIWEQQIRKRTEIDFVCNLGSRRYYIQSAFSILDGEKMRQESQPLVSVADSFKKIIVVKDPIKLWRTEEGVVVMGMSQFLLEPNSLDL